MESNGGQYLVGTTGRGWGSLTEKWDHSLFVLRYQNPMNSSMEVDVGGVIIIITNMSNDNRNYPIGTYYYYDIVEECGSTLLCVSWSK
jgi:hypothetical protein